MDGLRRWHAMRVPTMQPQAPDPAGAELCELLRQLHVASGLTYEELAERTHLSRGTVGNYLTKPAHRRGIRELQLLLDALDAPAADQARALELRRQILARVDDLPAGVNAAEVAWRARARAAGCTVWSMAEFTADQATVHTAIGRRISLPGQHVDRPLTRTASGVRLWPPAAGPATASPADPSSPHPNPPRPRIPIWWPDRQLLHR
jgi:transcriptional regulator with XRE-family HTH domain